MNKCYIGDSVYVDYDGYALVLTTENGTGQPSNEIVLEPSVYSALVQFVESLSAVSNQPDDDPAKV